MQAVNQALFDDPSERQRLLAIAAGRSTEGGIRGGMSFIEEDKIRPGETLFRIGHSTKSTELNISSPWWMREPTFHQIIAVAERTEDDPIQVFRRFCAVSNDFGVADTVVRANVRLPLRAFTGRGRAVFDQAPGHRRKWTGVSGTEYKGDPWAGNHMVAQLFIPGLHDFQLRRPTPACLAALHIVKIMPLADYAKKNR